MELIYRGIAFDYDPSQGFVSYSPQFVHSSSAPYSLKYRGVTYQIDPSARQASSTKLKAYTLRYRSVTYFIYRSKQNQAISLSQVGNRS
jgi:hypothetical protein